MQRAQRAQTAQQRRPWGARGPASRLRWDGRVAQWHHSPASAAGRFTVPRSSPLIARVPSAVQSGPTGPTGRGRGHAGGGGGGGSGREGGTDEDGGGQVTDPGQLSSPGDDDDGDDGSGSGEENMIVAGAVLVGVEKRGRGDGDVRRSALTLARRPGSAPVNRSGCPVASHAFAPEGTWGEEVPWVPRQGPPAYRPAPSPHRMGRAVVSAGRRRRRRGRTGHSPARKEHSGRGGGGVGDQDGSGGSRERRPVSAGPAGQGGVGSLAAARASQGASATGGRPAVAGHTMGSDGHERSFGQWISDREYQQPFYTLSRAQRRRWGKVAKPQHGFSYSMRRLRDSRGGHGGERRGAHQRHLSPGKNDRGAPSSGGEETPLSPGAAAAHSRRERTLQAPQQVSPWIAQMEALSESYRQAALLPSAAAPPPPRLTYGRVLDSVLGR
jgi:hypothetical protein